MKKSFITIVILLLVMFIIGCDSHEHSFIEGKCECGENDPNYIPPHEHSFIEGKCECEEEDPNYIPSHEHSFTEGKCECGENDPNYIPPHEHSFIEGKCECGEEDPNYVPPHEHTFGLKGFCFCGEIFIYEHEFVDGKCRCRLEEGGQTPVLKNLIKDYEDNIRTFEFDKKVEYIETIPGSSSRMYVSSDTDFIEYMLSIIDVEYIEQDFVKMQGVDTIDLHLHGSHQSYTITIYLENQEYICLFIWANGNYTCEFSYLEGSYYVLEPIDYYDMMRYFAQNTVWEIR